MPFSPGPRYAGVMEDAPLLAGVEAGGTKFVVAVGRDPLAPLVSERVPTTSPAETLAAVAVVIGGARDRHGPVAALGIASFGPLDLHRGSPSWGRILATTKPGWEGADIAGGLGGALGLPAAIDTDVNGAALAEARWGAGRGIGSLAYLTVGTGIGGGLVLDGRPRHGLLHPEIGHVPLRRHPQDDFPGACSFHGDCAEGLASGPAIAARLGMPLDEAPAHHPFRAILADYLGQLCAILVLVTSVERIVIGGGVVQGTDIHPAVQARMRAWLGGYIVGDALAAPSFVVPPALGDRSGIAGAFALAAEAAR